MFIESDCAMDNLVLPDTSLVLAICFRGSVSVNDLGDDVLLPPAVLSGIRKKPRLIRYAANTAALLVIFEPRGASVFCREPLHELAGISLPADALKGFGDMHAIVDKLSTLKDQLAQINFIEQTLLARIIKPEADSLVSEAVRQIQSAHGNVLVHELAHKLYISQDAFEKRFRKIAGTSPKHFSSIIRLRHVIDQYSVNKSLTSLAHDAGYYDQAHFNRDFKTFTAKTPRQFFNGSAFW